MSISALLRITEVGVIKANIAAKKPIVMSMEPRLVRGMAFNWLYHLRSFPH